MVWLIATARPGTIWFIDEPELHLHPGAQKLFYDYLIKKTEDSQIFVTSHSMVFIHKSELYQVTLLIYDEAGVRNVLLADLIDAEKENSNSNEGLKEIRSKVYSALGYDPAFVLEPKTVVIVEGHADMQILTSFCKILNRPIDGKAVHFLIVGDKGAARNFSPILIYALSNKKCLIILDNDKGVPEDTKQSLCNAEKNYRIKIHFDQPLLSDENFFLYPQEVYSIEYYLLEPQAISRTFGITDESIINEISKSINNNIENIKNKYILPKNFLNELCEKYSQSYYSTDIAIRIANNLSPNHLKKFPEIINLVYMITN